MAERADILGLLRSGSLEGEPMRLIKRALAVLRMKARGLPASFTLDERSTMVTASALPPQATLVLTGRSPDIVKALVKRPFSRLSGEGG